MAVYFLENTSQTHACTHPNMTSSTNTLRPKHGILCVYSEQDGETVQTYMLALVINATKYILYYKKPRYESLIVTATLYQDVIRRHVLAYCLSSCACI